MTNDRWELHPEVSHEYKYAIERFIACIGGEHVCGRMCESMLETAANIEGRCRTHQRVSPSTSNESVQEEVTWIDHSQAHVTLTRPRSWSANLSNMAGLTSRSLGWHPVPARVSTATNCHLNLIQIRDTHIYQPQSGRHWLPAQSSRRPFSPGSCGRTVGSCSDCCLAVSHQK
jgi:hypothetical protein